MKANARKFWKALIALFLVFTLASVSESQSKSGSDMTDSLVNSGSGQVQVSMAHPIGWLVAFIVKNPKIYPINQATDVVKILMPVILGMLIPLWQMLILLNGVYFIWGARDPASRNAAKQRIMQLIFGMILCSLSMPIFQMILDVESGLAKQVLAASRMDPSEMAGGYLMGVGVAIIIVLVLVKILAVSWGSAIIPIVMLILIPFIALGLRYVAVIIFALLFPFMLFTYFFDFTKKIGSKLFRTAMLWVSVPIVQAIFLVVMLEGVKMAQRMNVMGGFIALACFVMIGAAPFMMEGMMGAVGGALIHSGYTTSNPRLVMMGNLISGQGPASFTSTAWYGSMGSQSPIGGKFAEAQTAAGLLKGDSGNPGLPGIPAVGGTSARKQMREEKGGLNDKISKKEKERDAATDPHQKMVLDHEISQLKKEREHASIAHIPDEVRKLARECKSYDELHRRLGGGTDANAMIWRMYNEQKSGINNGAPNLLSHGRAIGLKYFTSPISPGELLAPLGSLLTGLMTYMVPPELPLGKSLLGLSNKMIPHVETTTTKDGTKVAVVKQEWGSWSDVAKSALKSKAMAYGAGLSVAGVLGAPLVLSAFGIGLSMKAFSHLEELGEASDKKIEGLKKQPTKLKEMRQLREAQINGFTGMTPVQREEAEKKIKGYESEFNGMKIGDVLKRYETGQMATSREFDKLQAKVRGGGPLSTDEQKRLDELRVAWGYDSTVSNQRAVRGVEADVDQERQRLQKIELRKMETDPAAVDRLVKLGSSPLTSAEESRLNAIEAKERSLTTLTTAEKADKQRLSKKREQYNAMDDKGKAEQKRLAAVFGVDMDAGQNLGKAISDRSKTLKKGLDDRWINAQNTLRNDELGKLANSTELEGLDAKLGGSADFAAGTDEKKRVDDLRKAFGLGGIYSDRQVLDLVGVDVNDERKKIGIPTNPTDLHAFMAKKNEMRAVRKFSHSGSRKELGSDIQKLDRLESDVAAYGSATTPQERATLENKYQAEMAAAGVTDLNQLFAKRQAELQGKYKDDIQAFGATGGGGGTSATLKDLQSKVQSNPEVQKMIKDETILGFADVSGRQRLQRDIDSYDQLAKDKAEYATAPVDKKKELEAKYKTEMMKHGISSGIGSATNPFDEMLTRRERELHERYGEQASAMGFSPYPPGRMQGAHLKQLQTSVYSELGIDPAEEKRKLVRQSVLAAKQNDPHSRGTFSASDSKEWDQINRYLNRHDDKKLDEVHDSVQFRRGATEDTSSEAEAQSSAKKRGVSINDELELLGKII